MLPGCERGAKAPRSLDAWTTLTPHEMFLNEIRERQGAGDLPWFPPERGALQAAPSRADRAQRQRQKREQGWAAPMAKGSALPAYRASEDGNVHLDYRERFGRRVSRLERREAQRVRTGQLANVRKTEALCAQAKRDYDERRLVEEQGAAEARASGESGSQFGAPPRVVQLTEWLYSGSLRRQIVAQEQADIHLVAS